MSVLSFSRSDSIVFPEEVQGYPIDPRFRNIMWILRTLNDETKSPRQRIAYALRSFFREDIPEENAIEMLYGFLNAGQESGEDGREPPHMDFEFDADEIYADFWREYRIDLFTDDTMHWYRFLALLGGLSDYGALSRKIQIRTRDISKLKGKERAQAEKAKERVQIPQRLTAEELREAEAFEAEWGNL